jgi:hypothetical protein
MFKNVISSVSHPDPGSIGSVDPDPDQDSDLGRAKRPTKKEKIKKFHVVKSGTFTLVS